MHNYRAIVGDHVNKILLQVKLSVIWEYIKSCTFSIGFLTLLFYIGYNGCFVGANVWLAKWSTDEGKGNKSQKLTTLVLLATALLLTIIAIL